MEKQKVKQELETLISQDTRIMMDEPMKRHTSFKVGGPADLFVKVANIEDLKNIVRYCLKSGTPYYVIGNGSNLVVTDKGIRGVIIKINWKKVEIKEAEKCYVTVSSGVSLSFLAQKLLQKEIEGFEFASGIPGTIGGAIRMNAGAHGSEMKDIVSSIKALNEKGEIVYLSKEECQFSYRNSIFSKEKLILLEVTFLLAKGESVKIKEKMEEYAIWRKEKQPLEYPNAGSTFKRGDGYITAALIDECGLKGYQIGGAQVSEKHAGFIINKEEATAKDILDLIQYVKEQVKQKSQKEIELEIEVIGEE